MRDTENSMMYSPLDHHGFKFMGSWNKLINLKNTLMYEDKDKYFYEYQVRMTAKLQMGSVPVCFNKCVSDVEAAGGLSSDEKNCIRECYFKRVTSKDDFNLLLQ
jgi:hypothetical protein